MLMEPKQADKIGSSEQKRGINSRRVRLVLTIAVTIVFALLIIIAQVLGSLQIIPAVWVTISSAIAGVSGTAFAFISLLPLLFPSEKPSLPQVTHVPVPVIISGGTAHIATTITESAEGLPTQSHHIVVQPHTTSMLQLPGSKTAFRGVVGFLPPTDARTIEQRVKSVEEVYTKLTQADVTAIVLTGISGVGKSTLAGLVYRHAEALRKTSSGHFYAEPIWLTINFDTAMIDVVGTIFEKLGLPVPELDQQSPQNQAGELFNVLNSLDKARLIVLDQFENLLDVQTGRVRVERPGVGEWLDIINSQIVQSGCRLLLTSRMLPKSTHIYPLTHLQEYCCEGLSLDEGMELLKKQVSDESATEKDLRLAVERCGGHAYSLTLLASLLRNHHLSLSELFSDPTYEELWEGDIAHNFLDYIYENQLTVVQRQLLQAFSVYREGVPLAAVQAAIDPGVCINGKDLLVAITVLLNLHLLLPEREGRYALHALIAHYARRHFDAENERHNQALLYEAHARAALYYQHRALTAYPPRGKRQTIRDVKPYIEATWQLIHAERCAEAYALMEREELFVDLDRLGGAAILLELYELLFPLDKWHAMPVQMASVYKYYGRVHSRIQARGKSLEYYENALELYRTAGDSDGQCEVLVYLGEALHDSDIARTLKVYQEALSLARNVGHRKNEAMVLNHLSWVYKGLGDLEQGRSSGELALSIYQELDDHWGESRCFDALGEVYAALGLQEQALKAFEQALRLYRELGNHWQEGWMLIHIGGIYYDQHQQEQAQKQYEQALEIGKQVGNGWVENASLNRLGNILQHKGELQQAKDYYEQALQGVREIKDSWGEGRALHSLGKLAYEQGHQQEALLYLSKAFSINKEIGNYLEVVNTLYDVSVICLEQKQYDRTLAVLLMIQKDYKITQSQSPKLKAINALHDMLRASAEEDTYPDLLAQVEPDYVQIVKQTLDVSP
jgi:tetratricopeptide (TPR) repeat protein